MLFLGEHRHSIDAKGRVSLPVRFRSALPGPVVLAQGFDDELRIYTADGYVEFLNELGSFDQFKGRVREARRWFTANAAELDLDKAGRINVPARFAQWAGLSSETVVLGSGDHIELWSPEKWDAYQATRGNIADIAEEISDLGVF